ncbi:MAG TPA: hypothetical protein VN774_03560, partial [Candidatus Limnocylindrales bacterium]|nr:hypothetical protein [Candidatus Limnocylindrales bacterium]
MENSLASHSFFSTRAVTALAIILFLFAYSIGAAFSQATGKSYALPTGDYRVDQFAISNDETAILFTASHSPDDGKQDVFLFDLKAGQVKKLLTGG